MCGGADVIGVKVLGDLVKEMQAEVRAGEKAVKAGVSAAAIGLKNDWRAQVEGAGLGRKLALSIRSEAYPPGRPSLNAAAQIWSKAPKVVAAHDSGPLIKAVNGSWLAIPQPAAGTGLRGGRITPDQWKRRTGMALRFVPPRGPGMPALLVADDARINKRGLAQVKRGRRRKDGILRGAMTVPIFILVQQVQLRKKIDLKSAAEAWGARLSGLVVASWRD